MTLHADGARIPQIELVVVGLSYFEVQHPKGCDWPSPGTEVFTGPIRLGFGGAMNVCSVAAALGIRVCLAAPRGEGPSDWAIDRFVRSRSIQTLRWPAQDDPAVSLVRLQDNDRAFISHADHDALGRCPPLPPAKRICLTGLSDDPRLAARLARARARGSRVTVGGSFAPAVLARMRHQAVLPMDELFLNEKEAALLGGDPDAPDGIPDHLAASYLVTAGARGGAGRIDGTRVQVPARPVEVFDPTGAGDALMAGYLAARLRGRAPRPAVDFGARVAARMLSLPGGTLWNRDGLSDLAKELRDHDPNPEHHRRGQRLYPRADQGPDRSRRPAGSSRDSPA